MTTTQHQSDAVAALISGALTNPHLPDGPTAERARKVLPWLARESDHAVAWEITATAKHSVKLTGRLHRDDTTERRSAIQAWADVIGSRSISDRDGHLEVIGMYQGFPVELTATS